MRAPPLSIRLKLVAVTLSTAVAALAVLVGATTWYDIRTYTDARIMDMSTQAELLGAASAGALSFDDPAAAEQNLGVLRYRPRVIGAAIYDARGALFATYVREGEAPPFPRLPGDESVGVEAGDLITFQRIVQNDEILGTAYIRAEFGRQQRMQDYAALAVPAVLAALLLALLLAVWLQRVITRPILLINRAARGVVERREYSLRAEKVTDDEVGTLADSFNLMLDEIHDRTTALEQENAARLRAEQEVRELNADLERRIRERTAQLERSNQELESFSYTVSHDLRSPLRAITGFAQALKQRLPDLDPESARYFDRIQAAIRRMGQRIDGLLNLAHLARRDLNLQTIDLGELAAEAIADLQQRDPGRVVDINIWDNLEVKGDPKLLRALMENLLENAWKFSADAEVPRVEVGAMREDGRTVYFVRDNGAGFDMAFADKLFQPFQRLHGAAEFPGTGIGLATVKRIVERHGGRIWADAGPGKGAVFYFTLDNGGSDT